MLGLLLIYFIGRYFYKLAEEYEKNKWLFAILGIIAYYVGTFIAGIVYAIVFDVIANSSIENVNDIALAFMAMPFGIGTCAVLYYILKKTWEKPNLEDPDIIDHI